MSGAAFRMYRGDTAAIQLNFVQKEDPDEPYNLTGLTLTITASSKQNPTASAEDAALELWSVAMSIVSAALGTATFALSASQADMTPGTYYFDVEGLDGGSLKKTLHKGAFLVLQDIRK